MWPEFILTARVVCYSLIYLEVGCDFDHSQSSSGSTPSTSYFGSPGVLPVWLYHFCGSKLPVPCFKPCRSAPSRTIPLLCEHSRKSGIAGPGALPEWLFCYSGSKVFMIYNFDILLPVLLFLSPGVLPQQWYSGSGSTPRATILSLRE